MKRLLTGVAIALAGAGAYTLVRATRADRSLAGRGTGPRILILGAGFAGLTAAGDLARRLEGRARITLVDRHNYHLFTPLLYQAATCGVDPYDVAYPIREFSGRHHIAFRRGTVTNIDLKARHVQLDNGRLDYDYLVIALGATTNFFGNQEAQQHALPIKSLEDGIAIRNHVVDMLDRANITTDPQARQALLTFVVVGGGATGVETAAALADLLRQVLHDNYPRLDPNQVRVLLIESEGKLLGHMSDRMAEVALRDIRAQGVEVWLNAKARDMADGRVTTEDGRSLASHTVIWTTGVRAAPVVARMDASHGKGGSLAVDSYLQVQEHPGVFAIGDNAHIEDRRTHHGVPLLAQSAVQEAHIAAENLAREIEGQPQQPFEYRSLGDVVSLGHRAGVAEVGGLVWNGVVGWLLWRVVHLARVTSFRNKLATAIDWTFGYIYNEDITRLEVEPSGSGE